MLSIRNPARVSMAEIKSVSIVSVVTICLAIAAGAWGLSNTIALSRVKDVENNITIGVTDRGQIWRAIERLTESANNREKKLDEIQADVKALLRQSDTH